MNKYKKLLSNSIIFAIGNLTVKVAQFFLLPILTLYFTTDEYGLSTTLLDMVELLTPLVTLGIAEGLFRFTVDGSHKNEELLSSGTAVVLCGFVIFAVGDLIIYAMYPQEYILWLIPLFFVRGIKKLLAEFARGLGRTVLYAFSGILESFALIGSAALFLLVFDMGISGYVLALMVSALVSMIFYVLICKPHRYIKFSAITKKKLKAMVLYSLPSIPNMLSWWIVQLSSQYVIIWFVGMDAKGLFTAASKIPALINVVSNIFLQAWSLSSAEECADEARNKFYSQIYRYYRVLIAFAVCAVIVITPYISKFLLQASFYSAWKYSPVLIVASGLGCISAFFGAFFGAFYKPHLGTITTLIGAVLNIGLSFSLVPFIGVYGAIIANTCSYIAIVISRILYCRNLVKLDIGHTKTAISFVLLLLQATVYTFNLKFKIISGVVVLLLLALLYFKDIKGLIKIVVSMLKGKKIKAEKVENSTNNSESEQAQTLDKNS
jgi:O-antigen/teichoic acid export membrane protein